MAAPASAAALVRAAPQFCHFRVHSYDAFMRVRLQAMPHNTAGRGHVCEQNHLAVPVSWVGGLGGCLAV